MPPEGAWANSVNSACLMGIRSPWAPGSGRRPDRRSGGFLRRCGKPLRSQGRFGFGGGGLAALRTRAAPMSAAVLLEVLHTRAVSGRGAVVVGDTKPIAYSGLRGRRLDKMRLATHVRTPIIADTSARVLCRSIFKGSAPSPSEQQLRSSWSPQICGGSHPERRTSGASIDIHSPGLSARTSTHLRGGDQ